MANPLAQRFGVVPQAKPKSIVEQFREFRQSFTGDPQAKINEMLASGQVTQAQVKQATELANLIKAMCCK